MNGFLGDDSLASFAEELAGDIADQYGQSATYGSGANGDSSYEPGADGYYAQSTDYDIEELPPLEDDASPDTSFIEQEKLKLLEGLNEPQREAVTTTEGPVLVLAGAGSGKTTVLTRRIAWILLSDYAKSHQILGVTFTNKAARELAERLRRLCGISHFANVGTFHSVCSRWLRREAERLGFSPNFTIFDGSAQIMLMKQVLKELNIDAKNVSPRKALALVSKCKNDGRKPIGLSHSSDLLERRLGDIYDLYNRKLRENEALDFDDILVYTVTLLRDFPEVRAMYTERLKYILVDEYQDVNAVQYELLRLLVGEKRNICAVGDDDQSIYKFRGADLSIILRFKEDFSEGKVIKLEQNYRSTQAILDLANEVISKNRGRTGKKLWSDSDGQKPQVYGARTAREEGEFVGETIQRLRDSYGFNYSDFAILYRANAMSRIFEEVLLRRGIVHKIVGGQRFFERAEIKDLLVYFSVFNNFHDSVSVHRILENTPGIGATTLQKMAAWGVQNNKSLFETMEFGELLGLRKSTIESLQKIREWLVQMSAKAHKKMPLSKMLHEVLDFSNYREILRKRSDGDLDFASRMENVDELINTLTSFDATHTNTAFPLEAFMAEVSLYSDQDDYDTDADKVTLMTVHTSKGLEFPVIFLVGLEENTLPSYLSLQTGSNDDVEEERRLCYVGMTRAKKRLFLSFSCRRDRQGTPFECDVSRFLLDASMDRYICMNSIAQQRLSDERGSEEANVRVVTALRDYCESGATIHPRRRAEKKRVYDTLKGLEHEVMRRDHSGSELVSTWGTRLGQTFESDIDVHGGLRETMKKRQSQVSKHTIAKRTSVNERYRAIAEKFPVGCTVIHKLFGLGTVVSVDHGFVTVRFSENSQRMLCADVLTPQSAGTPTSAREAKPTNASASANESGEHASVVAPCREARVGDWIQMSSFGRGIIQAKRGDKFEVSFSGLKRLIDGKVIQTIWKKQHTDN